MTDDDKYKVISLLQNGIDAKEIADAMGASVSYGAILKLKREYRDAKVNNTVDKLINADKLLLAKVGEELSDVVDVSKAVTDLTKGVDGLERLGTSLQKTALKLSDQVAFIMLNTEHLPELKIAAEILCDLQTAFLNKNTTQVNVQNNFGAEGNTPRYAQYLNDQVVQ